MRRTGITMLGILLLLPACRPGQAPEATPQQATPEVEYLASEATASLDLPFSGAVRVGDVLYLSGTIGHVAGKRELVPGGVRAETRQAMEHIRSLLEHHGSSLDRLVHCTVMMADMNEWPAMNEVYRSFFTGPYPARSAFGVTGLALGARVEIECLAAVGHTAHEAAAGSPGG